MKTRVLPGPPAPATPVNQGAAVIPGTDPPEGTGRAVWRLLKRQARVFLWHLTRLPPGLDRRLVRTYLKQHRVQALHVGCGAHLLDGWLNADLYPRASRVLHLDATKPFPVANASFDYIFTEHMIEHLSFSQGGHMLRECCRVLKPGGTLRVSTPDLAAVLDLYRDDKSTVQQEYLHWIAAQAPTDAPRVEEVFVINELFRGWGHRFLYDERVLRQALDRAGFVSATRCRLNDSSTRTLRDLEHASRMPEGCLALESLVLEARAPAGRTL